MCAEKLMRFWKKSMIFSQISWYVSHSLWYVLRTFFTKKHYFRKIRNRKNVCPRSTSPLCGDRTLARPTSVAGALCSIPQQLITVVNKDSKSGIYVNVGDVWTTPHRFSSIQVPRMVACCLEFTNKRQSNIISRGFNDLEFERVWVLV